MERRSLSPAEYDGNVDVFVMPAEGGVPRRLTYHPGQDDAVGWTPDGKRVLFVSNRAIPNDGARLYTLPAEGGGLPDELPLPIALEGTYSADGSHLAYVPLFQWQEAWKRYRGGQTTQDLDRRSGRFAASCKIPRDNSNDFNPMWIGDRIYFLSDREGPVTLFYYDTKTKKVTRAVVNHRPRLQIGRRRTGRDRLRAVRSTPPVRSEDRQRRAGQCHSGGRPAGTAAAFRQCSQAACECRHFPEWVRAVFEARGEIITVPADKGDVAEPDEYHRRNGARAGLVARRTEHRLLFR